LELVSLYSTFSLKGFEEIKKIEKETNHDVKAVEYFVKNRLSGDMADLKEMVHFGLTSEDVTNLALSMSLKDANSEVMVPALVNVLEKVTDFAEKTADIPMLARTHGQPASPTTMGKEFANFAYRLNVKARKLAEFKFEGKLNGATGNFNAHTAAFPDVSWEAFSRSLVEDMGLEYAPYTTQILPHDNVSDYFRETVGTNKVLEGFAQDAWRYISDDWIKQKVKKEETGSSTMPHKVNPIDFENSEGNLQIADALLTGIADKMQISRLQRDLSGSTVTRKYGVALGYVLIGCKSLARGMEKIEPNAEETKHILDSHPEVIAEPIQTILRTKGADKPYEKLKELTRGRKVSLAEIRTFVHGLDVDKETMDRLLALTPETYIGYAKDLTNAAVAECRKTIKELKKS
jgi:adenylosuccinate lyase